MNIYQLLKGAYDLHVHSAPDLSPRIFDDLDLALEYSKYEMGGIVIKSHFGETASRAKLANHHVKGIEVYGGVTLNKCVGGLNVYAVESTLKLGGKIVWMPTIDAANHKRKTGKMDGISVLDINGNIKPEVFEIIKLIKEFNCVVSTGHLSFRETTALITAAQEEKIKAIIVAHPEFWITSLSLNLQKHLLQENVYFERCYYSSTLEENKKTPFQYSIDCIKTLGCQSTILSSDLGQAHNMPPAEGLAIMIDSLLKAGFLENDINLMIKDNQKKILF